MNRTRCAWCRDGGINQQYHDREWGIPLHDDAKQFEFLMMEAMQCGLSWTLMLKKREIFRQCFAGFDYRRVAAFTEDDVTRILNTEGMIRSQGKIRAVIHNAGCFLEIVAQWGSFDRYIWSFTGGKTYVYPKHHQGCWVAENPLSHQISRDLKKRGFRYLGPVTVYSHLQACGVINDHEPECWMYRPLLEQNQYEFRYD